MLLLHLEISSKVFEIGVLGVGRRGRGSSLQGERGQQERIGMIDEGVNVLEDGASMGLGGPWRWGGGRGSSSQSRKSLD